METTVFLGCAPTHAHARLPLFLLPMKVTLPPMGDEDRIAIDIIREASIDSYNYSPPLLRNHRWHVMHCIAPRCSCTGFARSIAHLCLFLSDFLLNCTRLTPHILGWFIAILLWMLLLALLMHLQPITRHPPLERVASSYHSDSGTPTAFKSFLI